MTYHQTKGREVDTAIHLYRDIFGIGGEPYEEASRVLNVAISRARKRVVMILPPDPHLLVKPFNDLTDVQKSVLESMESIQRGFARPVQGAMTRLPISPGEDRGGMATMSATGLSRHRRCHFGTAQCDLQ